MEKKRSSDTDLTIEYYNQNAKDFVDSTIYVDMKHLYSKFEQLIAPNSRILDLGCGSGRDSKYFFENGYQVVSIDASEAMCAKTRDLTENLVLQMRMEEIDFIEEFDAVWACASLLHIPRSEMKGVITKVFASIKIGGVFYASWKCGQEERISKGRYFNDYEEETLKLLFETFSNICVLEMWRTRDVRVGRQEESWINVLIRKYR